MPVPSNETEAEKLERRKVEALERIASQLQKFVDAVEHFVIGFSSTMKK